MNEHAKSLFTGLDDWSAERTAGQAAAFWLVYAGGTVIASIPFAANEIVRVGLADALGTRGMHFVVTALVVATVSFGLCHRKGLAAPWWIVAGAATVIALYGGALLGMVPAAVLTTCRPPGVAAGIRYRAPGGAASAGQKRRSPVRAPVAAHRPAPSRMNGR